MGKTVFVVNPKSANGKTAGEVDALRQRATAMFPDVEFALTERPGHATELCARAIDGGAECIVAVGGDGTNNEVINGFVHPDGTVRRAGARFSFLPRGTGGDFRRTFGFGKDVDGALARIKGGARPTDVGFLEFTAHDGSKGKRAFINIASAGLSGMVDKMVNGTSKALGPMSFFVGSLRGLLAFHPYQMTIKIDGTLFHEGKAALGTAANGQYFGGGMQVAPAADPGDGLLDVTVLPAWGSARFIAESRRLYAGDIRMADGVKVGRGKLIEMDSPEEVLLDVDGEQPGRLPATFRVLEGAVQMCR